LNNSSKKEFLCQAGLVLGSMWQLILTSSGTDVPLVIEQQHAPIFLSNNLSLHSSRSRRPLRNEHAGSSWIFEWIVTNEIDFTFLCFLCYLALSIGAIGEIPDRLRFEHDETRTQQMKTIYLLEKSSTYAFF